MTDKKIIGILPNYYVHVMDLVRSRGFFHFAGGVGGDHVAASSCGPLHTQTVDLESSE